MQERSDAYREDINALDNAVMENGELLYRYQIRIKNLPDGALTINSAQIYLNYDRDALEFRRGEGPVNWMITENGERLSAAWASDTGVAIRDNDVMLTLYFAKKANAAGAVKEIAFVPNEDLHTVSGISYVRDGVTIELEADAVNGSIRLEDPLWGDANADGKVTSADAATVLRAIVNLSKLSVRGALLADADGDGVITATDAAMILQYVVGLIETLHTEQ